MWDVGMMAMFVVGTCATIYGALDLEVLEDVFGGLTTERSESPATLSPNKGWDPNLATLHTAWKAIHHAVRFSLTTLSTVGLGVDVPTNLLQQVALLLSVPFGIGLFAHVANEVAEGVLPLLTRGAGVLPSPFSPKSEAGRVVGSVVWVVAVMGVVGMAFGVAEGWAVGDAFYFVGLLVSTVGYGEDDLKPESGLGLVLLGITTLGVSGVVGYALFTIQQAMASGIYSLAEAIIPSVYGADVGGNGEGEEEMDRVDALRRSPFLLVGVVGVLATGFAMMMWVLEGMAVDDGLWLAWASFTTVGYGEVVPATTTGRLACILYALPCMGLISLLSCRVVVAQVSLLASILGQENMDDIPRTTMVLFVGGCAVGYLLLGSGLFALLHTAGEGPAFAGVEENASFLSAFCSGLWWSAVSTSTLGFGMVYPVTLVARMVCGGYVLLGLGLIDHALEMLKSWLVDVLSLNPPPPAESKAKARWGAVRATISSRLDSGSFPAYRNPFASVLARASARRAALAHSATLHSTEKMVELWHHHDQHGVAEECCGKEKEE